MKKILIYMTIIFINILNSAENIRISGFPYIYNKPSEDIDVSKVYPSDPGTPWYVFSDRNNNKTYKQPNGRAVQNQIDYLQVFWVIDEKNEWLHIVKDDSVTGYYLTSQYKDYGWIKKQNMFLMRHALVTRKGKIDKKAMLLNTIPYIKDTKITNLANITTVQFYNDPDLQQKNKNISQLFEIFYIYKINEKSVLLGKDNRIPEYEGIKNNLLGWVDKNKIIFWDHRIVIEPNWETHAASERKTKNISAKIFTDANAAQKYAEENIIENNYVMWESDSFEKRKTGEWRRFPILDDEIIGGAKNKNNLNLSYVGAMGEVINNKGEKISREEMAVITQKYNKLREAFQNLNLVFVVDGTTSMEPYFLSVVGAINSTMDQITKKYPKIRTSFGGVIYRDLAEGKKITEILRLTENYKKVIEFFKNAQAIDKFDKDEPEALFYGLKTALRQVGFEEDKRNIIVLIGDAGNHSRIDNSQVDIGEIVKLIGINKCDMCVFQTHNKNRKTYNDFIEQTKNIVSFSAESRYKTYSPIESALSNTDKKAPVLVEITKNKYEMQNAPFKGILSYAGKGESNSRENIEKNVVDLIFRENDYLTNSIDILTKVIEDGMSIESAMEIVLGKVTKDVIANNSKVSNNIGTYTTDNYTAMMYEFMANMDIPIENLKLIDGSRFQFYVEGYTPRKVKGLNFPIWKPVLFLSDAELGDMRVILGHLLDATNSGNSRRDRLKDVWLNILKDHIGGGISDYEMNQMTMEEITAMVNELPHSTNILKDFKLVEITDPAIVSDTLISQYINDIRKKYNELARISNSVDYEYRFRSNGFSYYWIDENLLP